jgi:hypothetical protein
MSEELKTELEELKDRADLMGIKYSPNIGVDALKKKINDKLEGGEETSTEPTPSKTMKRKEVKQKATRLVRVIITCMNPNKKNAKGEYFSFANDHTGTLNRMVPFDTETHVEAALLGVIRNRKHTRVTMEKGDNGNPYPVRKLLPEFSIQELPPLTEKELADLAAEQAKRGAIDN